MTLNDLNILKTLLFDIDKLNNNNKLKLPVVAKG